MGRRMNDRHNEVKFKRGKLINDLRQQLTTGKDKEERNTSRNHCESISVLSFNRRSNRMRFSFNN